MKLLKLLGLFLALSIVSCTKDPAGCFTVDKGKTAKVNEEVQFDASCSANAETYSWDFGGLGTATGATTKFKFTKAGKYIIKLQAKKGDKSSEFTQEIDVL
jgi:PKD repeat protein